MFMEYLYKNNKSFFKRLTSTFGIGENIAQIIHKKLGLNLRHKPKLLTRKHSRNFEKLTKNIITEKKLKSQLNALSLFERSIRTHRSLRNKFKQQLNAKTNTKK